MRVLELLADLRRRRAAGRRSVVATLVDVRNSAPRDPGAVMLIGDDGELRGSISGGCVEAALVEEAQNVLRERRARIVDYGITDAQAQAAGLSCGGTLTVLLDEPGAAFLDHLEAAPARGAIVALTVRLDEGQPARLAIFEDDAFGTLGNPELDEAVRAEVRGGASGAQTEVRTYGEQGEPHGGVRIFIERILPRPRMYVFGAIDFAHAMVRVAKLLGFEVTLCDARPAFATPDRFPEADRVVCAWPDEFLTAAPVDDRTVIVGLTHDEKFDIPLIVTALSTRAGYIGVMGSRRTNERRMELLRERGVSERDLARLCAPIGLDLGARTPEETAIAIAAEIVAHRYGREGGRLTGHTGSLRGRPTLNA